jgi:hypothetical protein
MEASEALEEVLVPTLSKRTKEGTMEPALIADSKDTLLVIVLKGDAPTKPTLIS